MSAEAVPAYEVLPVTGAPLPSPPMCAVAQMVSSTASAPQHRSIENRRRLCQASCRSGGGTAAAAAAITAGADTAAAAAAAAVLCVVCTVSTLQPVVCLGHRQGWFRIHSAPWWQPVSVSSSSTITTARCDIRPKSALPSVQATLASLWRLMAARRSGGR